MQSTLCTPILETTVRCQVAASATLSCSAEAIAQWRKQPVVVGTEKLPASFLKHADDQTVLAWLTVRTALEQQGWQGRNFADWGVIAAGNFFGRGGIANSIQRFQQEGAWGASPHAIPQQSLHAMSGTISQALKIHGPNFGVSGAPNASPDAFLIAGAMLMDRQLPGLWVILAGYESEFLPAIDGKPTCVPTCQAVALALTPSQPNITGLSLSVGQICGAAADDPALAFLPDLHVGLLAEELSAQPGLTAGKWRLGESHWLELETIHASEGQT